MFTETTSYDFRIPSHSVVAPHIELVHLCASDPGYRDVLRIRASAFGVPESEAGNEFDLYSDHYCAYVNGMPVGALRVTRAVCGPLDCEEHVPMQALAAYRNHISSSSRFCQIKGAAPNANIAERLIKAAWQDQIRRGSRIDIICVRPSVVRYYARRGYRLVEGSYFVNPFRTKPNYVMLFTADPRQGGPLQQLLRGIEDTIPLETIRKCVPLVDSERPWATLMRRGMAAA
ncbi:MAG TPA: hypothetical protein VKU00_15990 [Chthonomonadaceae bacterium]|nr:hypothetical protein [Chthonomonadaceae bacterium]